MQETKGGNGDRRLVAILETLKDVTAELHQLRSIKLESISAGHSAVLAIIT